MSGFAAPRSALLVLFALALAGCGGGGGGGGGDGVSVDPKELHYTTTFGQWPDPIPVELTVKGVKAAVYLGVVIDGAAVSGLGDFYGVDANSAVADVYPRNSTELGPGRHTSTVTITACKDPACNSLYGTASFTATYEVFGVAAQDDTLDFDIGNVVAPADLHRQTVIRSYPPGAWSVSDNADWLTLSQAATATAGDTTLNVDLDAADIEAFDNGAQSATITLMPTSANPPGQVPAQVTVALDVLRTQASYVAPYVAVADTADEVIIRGDRFDEITVTGVKFGAQAAASFDVVSASEIRATHPALAAGTYPITLENPEGFGRWKAALSVVDSQPYAAGTLEYPPVGSGANWFARSMAYDAERRALLLALDYNNGPLNGRVVRYAYVDGAWQEPILSSAPRRQMSSVALSTDGRKVLSSDDYLYVREHDPVTLAETRTYFYDTFLFYLSNLSVTNDGFVVSPLDVNASSGQYGVLKYSIRDGTAPPPYWSFGEPLASVYARESVTSGDGSTVFMTAAGSPHYRYDAANGAVTNLGTSPRWWNTGVTTDRRGDRFLVDHKYIVDRDLAPLGTLPDDPWATAMSADGTRVYTYEGSNGVSKLRMFSLEPDGNGGVTVTELAPVTLGTSPGNFPVVMTLTPDEKTLFIAGVSRVVIYPLP